MMEEGGSGVESDAMAIVALVALIQDNHHHHRKGEGTLRFAIMDRPKKKTHTKAYRESGISGSRVSRVNECEPDNTEYVLPAAVSRRWFTTLHTYLFYIQVCGP